MRTATKIVMVLGSLVGLSAATLPSVSFASTQITIKEATVSAEISKYIGLAIVDHTEGETENSAVTYNDQTNTFTGTLAAGENVANFGTTTLRVSCNYLADIAPENETSEEETARLNDDCSNGWRISASASENYTATLDGANYAVMKPANARNTANIYSRSASLSGSEATWLLKTSGISKTVGSSTFTASPVNNYNNLNIVPASNTAVIEGNTFQTINNTLTYIGAQDITVQYGINAGMAPADTYTGKITYTLSIIPANSNGSGS